MLDVHRLRLLRELAARGTIAATARACALTPSAVSQQLSLLRREVGAQLLVRQGRTLVLTEAARVLVAHTERVLAELEAAQASVARLVGGVTGSIRLAAFPTAASSLVPSAIAACRASHPDLRIQLEEWETEEGIPALKAGRLDMLLIYEFNLLPTVDDPGVQVIPLVTESLLAVVPESETLPDPLCLADLRDQPWIAPGGDSALRAALHRACDLSGFAPRLDFTSDDYTVILALVRAGLGVSLIPQLATEDLATTGIRRCRLREPELTRRVSVAVRAGTGAAPAVAALVGALRHSADQLDLVALS